MGLDEQNQELIEGIKKILSGFICWNFPSLAPPKAKKYDWDSAPKAIIKLCKKYAEAK